ncbi:MULTISPECIES: hypothetical protein [unclassified Crossiella]|uniref:hypothetical protein n=1 Tax=unclassified Crossiella TaxID=2620835 RepID=UPI001FFE8A18|nr:MULTISPECIES: hypothetical protein [unclassified Crossiella]MCK2240951.1 hypothetical protein [Crossiella sp. S99.2]MCK2253905.1 hypothetical protein [Crossiella sp. S99.1]
MSDDHLTCLASQTLAIITVTADPPPGQPVEISLGELADNLPDRSVETALLVLTELEAAEFARHPGPARFRPHAHHIGAEEAAQIRLVRFEVYRTARSTWSSQPVQELDWAVTDYLDHAIWADQTLHPSHPRQSARYAQTCVGYDTPAGASAWYTANEDRLTYLIEVALLHGMHDLAAELAEATWHLAAHLGHHQVQADVCAQGVRALERGHRQRCAEFAGGAAHAHLALGRTEQAQQQASHAVELLAERPAPFDRLPQRAAQARAHLALARVQQATGDLAAALMSCTQAFGLAERSWCIQTITACRAARADVLAALGQHDPAAQELRLVIHLREEQGDTLGVALAQVQSARCQRLLGRETAADTAQSAVDTLRHSGSPRQLADAYAELLTAYSAHAPDIARELLPEAIQACETAGDPALAQHLRQCVEVGEAAHQQERP